MTNEGAKLTEDRPGYSDVCLLYGKAVDALVNRDGAFECSMASWCYPRDHLAQFGIRHPPIVGGGITLRRDGVEDHIFELVLPDKNDMANIHRAYLAWIEAVRVGMLAIPKVVDAKEGLVRWPHRFHFKSENDQSKITITFISRIRHLRKDVADIVINREHPIHAVN